MAIPGCGRIGQVRAGSVAALDGAGIVAVADALPEAAAAFARRHGAEARSIDGILASPDVDAVMIGTPTDTHYDLVHASAAAGKAIFCEKPVDMSAARLRDCIAAGDATGVPFMTGFNRRFDLGFAATERRRPG